VGDARQRAHAARAQDGGGDAGAARGRRGFDGIERRAREARPQWRPRTGRRDPAPARSSGFARLRAPAPAARRRWRTRCTSWPTAAAPRRGAGRRRYHCRRRSRRRNAAARRGPALQSAFITGQVEVDVVEGVRVDADAVAARPHQEAEQHDRPWCGTGSGCDRRVRRRGGGTTRTPGRSATPRARRRPSSAATRRRTARRPIHTSADIRPSRNTSSSKMPAPSEPTRLAIQARPAMASQRRARGSPSWSGPPRSGRAARRRRCPRGDHRRDAQPRDLLAAAATAPPAAPGQEPETQHQVRVPAEPVHRSSLQQQQLGAVAIRGGQARRSTS
jgi:hypothetical protein